MVFKLPKIAISVMLVSTILCSCTAIRVLTHEVTLKSELLNSGNYKNDPTHTSLIFKVNHFGFSNYIGRFNSVNATLNYESENLSNSNIVASIKTASIDTNSEILDSQLRGPFFFNSDSFPEAIFTSNNIKLTDKNQGKVIGTLRIKDKIAPMTLNVVFNGGGKNPLTQVDTLGFSATGSFNRSDFGLTTWLPAVGNTVIINIETEFIRH